LFIKKLIFGMISFIFFFSYANANISIDSEVLPNYYIKNLKTLEKQEFKLYKYNEQFLYLLNFQNKDFGDNFNIKDIYHEQLLNISLEKWNKVQDIIYFGYGYEDHTELKWYLITQYMIFQELDLDYTIIDEFDNDILIEYKVLYNQFLKTLNDYYDLPSFMSLDYLEFNYKDELILNDDNNVANLYDYIITTPGRVLYNNDYYQLSAKRPGIMELTLINKLYEYNPVSLFYNENAIFANRAGLSYKLYKIPVYAHGYGVGLTVVDENKEVISDAVFKLYNSKDKYIETFVTGVNGKSSVSFLPMDNYYLIQTSSDSKHKLVSEKIKLELEDFKNNEIVIYNEKIKGKVVINLKHKYLNKDDFYFGENILFEIYEGNKLITTKKTDELGNFFLELPIGEYTLKQRNNWNGFPLVRETKFSVNDEENAFVDIINESNYLIEVELGGLTDYQNIINKVYLLDDQLNKMDIDNYTVVNNKLFFQIPENKEYILYFCLNDKYIIEPIKLNYDKSNYITIKEEKSNNFDVLNNITKEDGKIIVDVPNTGIYIRPAFIIIFFCSLIISIYFYYVKK